MATRKRFTARSGLDGSAQTITNVADPVDPQDAATKSFSSNASNLTSGTIPQSVTVTPPILAVQGGLGWRDITTELTSKGGGSAPSLQLFSGLIYGYQFSNSNTNQLYAMFHIQHDYAPGTAIYFHVHWADMASAPSGDVRWGFEYTIAKGHGQQAFPATSTVYVTQASAGSGYHMVAEMPTGIISANLEPDSIIMVRVFRDASNSLDTCNNGSVFGFTCDVHYQTNCIATLNRAPNFYT